MSDIPAVEHISRVLSKCRDAAHLPTLLPLLIVEDEMLSLENKIFGTYDTLERTAEAIGMNPWTSSPRADQEADLMELTAGLTKLAQSLGQCKERCWRLLRAVEEVQEVHEQFAKFIYVEGESRSAEWHSVKARLVSVIEMTNGLDKGVDRAQTDVQANSQTVHQIHLPPTRPSYLEERLLVAVELLSNC